jgi:hypothetical protein
MIPKVRAFFFIRVGEIHSSEVKLVHDRLSRPPEQVAFFFRGAKRMKFDQIPGHLEMMQSLRSVLPQDPAYLAILREAALKVRTGQVVIPPTFLGEMIALFKPAHVPDCPEDLRPELEETVRFMEEHA